MIRSLCIVILFSCEAQPPHGKQIDVVFDCALLTAGNDGFICIADTDEPGEPLTIYGKLLDRETGLPVSQGTIFFFQADSAGIYNSIGMPTLAKIRGTVKVNKSGCFLVKTILPGDYPGTKDNRHLHFVLRAKGYKKVSKEFFFEGFVNDKLRNEPYGIVLPIVKSGKREWVGTTDLLMDHDD